MSPLARATCGALLAMSVSMPATAAHADENSAEQVADAMLGTWVADDNRFVDRRIRVHAPALGAVVVYLQLNQGEDRTLYRQRILLLESDPDTGKVRQRAFALLEPDAFVDAAPDHPGFASLEWEDLSAGFDEACAQSWERRGDGWFGYVDPERCRIHSKHGGEIRRIEAETWIRGTELRLAERGFDADGERQLFGTSPGEWLTLTRREEDRGAD